MEEYCPKNLVREKNSAIFLKSNPKFADLNNLIDSLGDNPELFAEDFKKIVRNLNKLLSENLINENIYEDILNIIKQVAIVYYHSSPNSKPLAYSCYNCGGYFLEKNEEFLNEKIHAQLDLKYVSYGLCSEFCRTNMDGVGKLEKIVDNPK